MPGNTLSFIPFDKVWRMRIDHPYSMFVREGDMAWSCGQCPLDAEGEVLYPDDLIAQGLVVCDFITRFMREIGCTVASLGRVVAYYVKRGPDDAATLLQLLRDRLGDGLQVIPVAVPHFYYDGMLLEIDIYAANSRRPLQSWRDAETGIVLEAIDAGAFIWAALRIPKDCPRPADAATGRLLAQAGLARDRLLADQWFTAQDVPCVVPGFDNARLVRTELAGEAMLGELTFAKSAVVSEVIAGPVALTFRRSGRHFYVAAHDAGGETGLVEQTRAIMRSIDAALGLRGLRFSDVRKSTTYYLAGGSAEELHLNMQVRNGYYGKPGPASTGLPVSGFPATSSLITVQLLGTAGPAGARTARHAPPQNPPDF